MSIHARAPLLIICLMTILIATPRSVGAQGGQPEWAATGQQNEIVRLFAAGKFAEALVLGKADLAAAEQRLGPDHPDLLARLEQLGMIHLARSNVSEAEVLFKREIAIAERHFGPRHEKTLSAMNALVAVYAMDNRMSEAAEIIKRTRVNP